MAAEIHDTLQTRCRQLGHPVPFKYCRLGAEGTPCRLIVDCWHERFDVMTFLHEHYKPEEIRRFLAPPRPKIASIVEMIDRARQNAGGGQAQ